MFERFTERARQVVVLAQEEARGHGINYIGTEHLLLGLIREEEGLACRVLADLGVTYEKANDKIMAIINPGDDRESTKNQIPFTPRAQKVLELALREALSLGHSYIGTEHILLALVKGHEGIAARVLLDFDGDYAKKARNDVIRLLHGPGGRRKSGEVKKTVPGERSTIFQEVGSEEHGIAVKENIDYVRNAWRRAARQEDPFFEATLPNGQICEFAINRVTRVINR